MQGQMVFHYRVIKELGEGGMGQVFLAEDTQLEREVAIKFLPADLVQDADRRRRFLTEAKAASALNHPNVCVIHEVGESEDGAPFLVMEYVAGETLTERVQTGPLKISTVIDIGLQVADALEAAAEKNIVHRDIKSANVIIDKRGRVKVLDFGLAKQLVNAKGSEALLNTTQTQLGQVLGTPSYMSPEQALGKSVDHRSDLFSLGILLYELATAKLPYAGSSFGETINQILHTQPEAIARFNYNSTPEFEYVVRKCMQKDPARRYQSAAELIIDLQNLQEGGTSSAAAEGSASPADFDPSDTAIGQAMQDTHTISVEEVRNSDVLISCAEVDDQTFVPGSEGWVAKLQRNLALRLEQLSGQSVSVQCHRISPQQEVANDALLEHLSEAKTVVSVVSPPFVRSEQCQRMMQECWAQAADVKTGGPRMFQVLKTPVNERELAPELTKILHGVVRFEFFEEEPDGSRIREFTEELGEIARQRYYEKIYDLAYEINRSLEDVAVTGEATAGDETVTCHVFLAETTSELREQRDRLRRELVAQGCVVLPENPLPLIAEESEAEVSSQLERSDLAIHLIGDRYGMVPEGAEESMAELQNRLAAGCTGTSGLQRLIWMPKGLHPKDERQSQFLKQLSGDTDAVAGADVIEGTLEKLKEVIKETWKAREESSAPASKASTTAPQLYLICERTDEAEVEALEDAFYDLGIEVSLPAFEEDEAVVSEVHWQNLTDCDGVLVYYGKCGKSWVDIKLRDLTKAAGYRGGRAIDVRAVYVGPPSDRRKERYKTLAAEVIRQEGDQFEADSLQSFVDALKAGKDSS